MKKVLMFLDYYSFGGIEATIDNLIDNLKEYNISTISFVNAKYSNKVHTFLKKDYRSFCKRNLLGIPKLKRYLENNNYDIIHIHCYNSFGLIYAFIARKYMKK